MFGDERRNPLFFLLAMIPTACVESVNFIEYNYQILSKSLDAGKQLPLGIGKGSVCRSHKEDHVCNGQQFLSQFGVIDMHCIRPRRIDQGEVLQQGRWVKIKDGGADGLLLRSQCASATVIICFIFIVAAVCQHLHCVGRREGSTLQHLSPQQRINQGTFAGIEFAGNAAKKCSVDCMRTR